ncbi:hypothetical protein ACVXHB_27810 [Escherichia coli]
MMDGWKGVKETWPAALVAGEASLSLSSLPLTILVGTAGYYFGAGEYRSLALFLKVWRPKIPKRQSAWDNPQVRWW